MPSDSLALAVEVCGQIELVTFLGGGLERGDGAGLAGHNIVGRLEIVLYIDIEALRGQIPHVAYGGLDLKCGAEVPVDSLGLCVGLHYHQGFTVFRA